LILGRNAQVAKKESDRIISEIKYHGMLYSRFQEVK